MRGLILSLAFIIVFNVDLNKASPDSKAKKYCENLLKNVTENKRTHENECQERIKEYFKKHIEKKDSVIRFAIQCEDFMKESWSRCTDIINHFSKPELCWNMETADSLFSIFHKNRFLSNADLDEIEFKYSDYVYFYKAGIIEMANSGLISATENSVKNTMGLLLYYKTLRDDMPKNESPSTTCNSDLVIGIFKFFCARKAFELKRVELLNYTLDILTVEEKKYLADFYRDICFKYYNDDLKIQWPLKYLEALADNAKQISFKIYKDFLIQGFKLRKMGWTIRSEPEENEWSLGLVLSKIMPQGSEKIDSYAVDTMSSMMKFGFLPETYGGYVNLLNRNDGFNSLECQNGIINSIYEKIRKIHHYSIRYLDKAKFNDHLKLLLDLFKKVSSCEYFIKYFVSIERIYYSSGWSEEYMNGLIEKATNSSIMINEFIDCLNFVEHVFKATEELFAGQKKNGSSPGQTYYEILFNKKEKLELNESKRQEFRERLLANGGKVKKFCCLDSEDINYAVLKKIYEDVFN